jgi:PAS domain S-box-containing protein
LKKTGSQAFKKAFKGFLEAHFCKRSPQEAMQYLSGNFSLIGTAIHEIALNLEESRPMFLGDYSEVPKPLTISDLVINVQMIDDFSAIVISTLGLKGQTDEIEFKIDTTRISALFYLEEKSPKIRHIHFSIPQDVSQGVESYPIKLLKYLFFETEEKYRLTFENAPIGIMHFDHLGTVKECNRKFLEIMGTTAEKVIGMQLLQLKDLQAVKAIEAALKGRTGIYEGYYQAVNSGKVVPLKVQISPLFGPEAQLIGGIGIYEDSSEHKIAESRLHYQFQFEKLVATISSSFVNAKTENLDSLVVNALRLTCRFIDADRGYVFLINPDGKTARNTHEWEESGIASIMHKYQNICIEDLEGMGGFIDRQVDHIHIPDINNFPPQLESVRHILTAGEVKSVLVLPLISHNRFKGCFGFDCVSSSRSWSYEEITLLKVIGEILANAFARKETEEKLIRSEEKYRFLAENASDLIWVVDLDDKKLIYTSPSAERMLGIKIWEQSEVNFLDLLSVDQQKFFAKEIPKRVKEFISGKSKQYTDEVLIISADGQSIPTENTSNLIRDPSTGHILAVGVTRDISLRKKAEEQRALLEMQKILAEKADSLGRMAETIACQFNNQLQIVRGNLELLENIIGNDKIMKRRVGDALKATSKAAELSSMMLSYLGHRDKGGVITESVAKPSKGKTRKTQVKENKKKDRKASESIASWNDLQKCSVLLIDPDELVRMVASGLLQHFGFKVIEAKNEEEAYKHLQRQGRKICLIILDQCNREESGCVKRIRQIQAETPIILASAYDKKFILNGKTNDKTLVFLAKPFGAKALQNAIQIALKQTLPN